MSNTYKTYIEKHEYRDVSMSYDEGLGSVCLIFSDYEPKWLREEQHQFVLNKEQVKWLIKKLKKAEKVI